MVTVSDYQMAVSLRRVQRAASRCLVLLLLLAIIAVDVAEARKRRGRGRHTRSKRKGQRFKDFRVIVSIMFVGLMVPVFWSFFTALRRDPAVPQLIKVTIEAVKRRFFSFLGKEGDPVPPSAAAGRAAAGRAAGRRTAASVNISGPPQGFDPTKNMNRPISAAGPGGTRGGGGMDVLRRRP